MLEKENLFHKQMIVYERVQRGADKQIIWIFYLISAILFFPGCKQRPEEADLERVSIAFQEWVGFGPLYLAREKGFFKEEGIGLVFIDEHLDSARRDAFKVR